HGCPASRPCRRTCSERVLGEPLPRRSPCSGAQLRAPRPRSAAPAARGQPRHPGGSHRFLCCPAAGAANICPSLGADPLARPALSARAT
ncbi:unnamed protein product, partial [Symbiodinium sp. CCMP2456]